MRTCCGNVSINNGPGARTHLNWAKLLVKMFTMLRHVVEHVLEVLVCVALSRRGVGSARAMARGQSPKNHLGKEHG